MITRIILASNWTIFPGGRELAALVGTQTDSPRGVANRTPPDPLIEKLKAAQAEQDWATVAKIAEQFQRRYAGGVTSRVYCLIGL